MNRKSKITVSIVGITIVLLALLGLTYAYYLTRIEGNTNTNSISVTTANLKLSYGDGTTQILTKENIIPDNNNPLGTKDFTVSNTGNTTIENYKVVLEYAVIDGIVPSVFKYPEDFEITLKCVSKNIETNAVSGTCNGTNLKWNNESTEMVKNTIAAGIRHEYSLVIKYVDSGIDQSDDMGKNLNLKVQIYGSTDTSTLNGTITGVESGYTMKLYSEPKTSVLIPTSNSGEYKYKFIGVEPGEHILYVLNKDGEVVSSETITIKKGTNTSVSGNTITVKDNQSNVYITSTNSGSILNSTATFNPYSSNTNSLAYHILDNALKTTQEENNDGKTMYRDIPLSVVNKEITKVWEESVGKEVNIYDGAYNETWWENINYGTSVETSADNLVIYDIMIQDDNSLLSSKETCETLIGKHISYEDYLGKVTDCDDDGKPYLETTKIATRYERILSVASDDYGTSHYFRGAVEDNYVNFAGMCWRIMRIQGDGSVKLILDDKNTTCNDDVDTDGEGTSDYAYTMDTVIGTGYYGYNTHTINGISVKIPDYLSGGMVKTFYDFQTTGKLKNYTDRLSSDGWCLNDTNIIYNGEKVDLLTAYTNVFTKGNDGFDYPRSNNFKCAGRLINKFENVTNVSEESDMYVATITVEELIYLGTVINNTEINKNYFDPCLVSSFCPWYKSLSLSFVEYYYEWGEIISNNSYDIDGGYPYDGSAFYDSSDLRPVIILKKGIEISDGDGTRLNPYIVD